MSLPVVRVSILRCPPAQFASLRQKMAESERVLAPGIRAMRGLIGFYAGADEATSSLTNVSLWRTLDDAKQLDHFRPMLDLGKEFIELGTTFERPIMNYASLWRLERTP